MKENDVIEELEYECVVELIEELMKVGEGDVLVLMSVDVFDVEVGNFIRESLEY